MTPTISDRILMAYDDGELDAEQRAGVERSAAVDPALAARLERHRALRTRVAAAYAGVLEEPVPTALAALARGQDPEAAKVVDLAAVRAARRGRGGAGWRTGGAMAACLAAGLALGAGWMALQATPSIAVRHGNLIAQGALARALSTQLASTQTADQPVRIGVSFRSKGGEFCRTFRIEGADAVAGLACRKPAAWSVEIAMAAAPAGERTGFRTAASAIPPPIMTTVDSLSSGAALDAQGEARARARGWLP
jgi:hypothetical protein